MGLLAHEMAVAPDYAARFVNVHVGSHKGAGAAFGIARVADGIARTLDAAAAAGPAGAAAAPQLVLENSAGSGDGIGASIEELEAILAAVAARGVPEARAGDLPRHGARLGRRPRHRDGTRASTPWWPRSTPGSGSTGW